MWMDQWGMPDVFEWSSPGDGFILENLVNCFFPLDEYQWSQFRDYLDMVTIKLGTIDKYFYLDSLHSYATLL